MEIHAQRVGVAGPHGPLLRPTSLRVRQGELALVAGEPGTGHTTLALVLSGRMRPSTGMVLLDGRTAEAELRRQTVVVDAPEVTEPEEALKLADVVGEELAMAGRPAGRKAVADWLTEQGADQLASARFENVPPQVRTEVQLALAALRTDARALLLVLPDRHHEDPHPWWEAARRHVTPDRAVVVLCSTSSARLLGVPAARLGQDEQPTPIGIAATQEFQETP
ncbi:ATP-binding cassette domain-containing protein [Solihabitans fulvus]|uniref:ATP-binding cassette domain-containing protein n=1 Tax=Solihabitans fulvus TaxID=1892852 RepID=A0A5B2XFD4_9PSEU|nr:ATP-binding cassette domain-containing protein [Solihabitans fulvus]KAA2261621.1 ATP-binding cassette domain-containing protein [Solihabitans fulvus]